MFQPCNYILLLKITLHLSNWIMLHFIMFILDSFPSHFKNLNNRHSSQLWEEVYEKKQLYRIRFLPWRHLPAIRLRHLTRGLSQCLPNAHKHSYQLLRGMQSKHSLAWRAVLAHGTLAWWLGKKKLLLPDFLFSFITVTSFSSSAALSSISEERHYYLGKLLVDDHMLPLSIISSQLLWEDTKK